MLPPFYLYSKTMWPLKLVLIPFHFWKRALEWTDWLTDWVRVCVCESEWVAEWVSAEIFFGLEPLPRILTHSLPRPQINHFVSRQRAVPCHAHWILSGADSERWVKRGQLASAVGCCLVACRHLWLFYRLFRQSFTVSDCGFVWLLESTSYQLLNLLRWSWVTLQQVHSAWEGKPR